MLNNKYYLRATLWVGLHLFLQFVSPGVATYTYATSQARLSYHPFQKNL